MDATKIFDWSLPVQLNKPKKHGEQITFEDYVDNMTKIEEYLNWYQYGGMISQFTDTDNVTYDKFIPLKEFRIQLDQPYTGGVVTVPTDAGILKLIQDSVVGIHKQIVGDIEVSSDSEAEQIKLDYNSGNLIKLKDGTSYDKTIAVAGDVLFFVKRADIDDFKTEEAIILTDLDMSIITSTNDANKRLTDVENSQGLITSRVSDLETASVDYLTKFNTSDITGVGAIGLTNTVTEPDKIPTRFEVGLELGILNSLIIGNSAGLDQRLSTVETGVKDIHLEDANNLKIDNLKNVNTTGSITLTGTEPNTIANREDVRQVVASVDNDIKGNNATKNITQLESDAELIRVRLDAIEKLNASGKKVFDTGGTLPSGDYAPKKNMVLFDKGLADNSQIILTDIPATSMDGGIAYVATDFAKDATTNQGPEVQLVVYGDESDPATTEDSLDAEWTGTQAFGQARAGKLQGIDMTTGHWHANFAINNDGVVVMKGFTAAIDPVTSAPYPVKRLILVQTTVDTSLVQTHPYYSKNEVDKKIADIDLTVKQDKVDTALSTTSNEIVGAINENKALLDTTRTTQAQLGAKVLSDGENLLDTKEIIATETWVTKSAIIPNEHISVDSDEQTLFNAMETLLKGAL